MQSGQGSKADWKRLNPNRHRNLNQQMKETAIKIKN
jgi:hypothetical protein